MKDRLPYGAATAALLLLSACADAPREIAAEAREIQGDCRTAEQLEGSDEACVAMFERAGERVHEGVRVWSGTVRALDRALDRLPPLEVDTAGLARAVTVMPEPEPRGGATLVAGGVEPAAIGRGGGGALRRAEASPVARPGVAPPRREVGARPTAPAVHGERDASLVRPRPHPRAERPVDRAVRPVDRVEAPS